MKQVARLQNDDGSWSFKLDYATFEQYIKAMDKWGTISDPKVCFTLMDEAWGDGRGY